MPTRKTLSKMKHAWSCARAEAAPIKAAVLPLVKKDGLAEIAETLEKKLRPLFTTYYDHAGAIGRRYRRMDEVGTPYCICVDHQTKEDETVTVRDRDTTEQVRMPIAELGTYILQRVSIRPLA